MKSPIYISALFVLGLGMTGCGDSLTSPTDNLDSQEASTHMSKVLERNSLPIGSLLVDGGSDSSTTDSAETDSTTTTSDPISPITLNGGGSKK